ncbi:MAG: hypothetical protein OEU92_34410, partial [Alphaproteobacteria bacterium]|nr:hypothetical protein [Alphaproteobacteria bacterium]
MKGRQTIVLIFVAAALCLARPGSPQAAEWLCNGGPAVHNDVPVVFWTSTFLSGHPDWIGGFQIALQAWNRNPSAFTFDPFVHIGTDDDPFGFDQPLVNIDNGRTEMWATTEDVFPTNGEGLSASAFAVPQLDGCNLGEIDILFNASLDYEVAETWTDFAPYNPATFLGPEPPPLLVQDVATHELGHAAGFGEECDLYSVMGDDNFHLQTNGTVAQVYAGTDVHDLLVSAYGPREVEDPSLLEDLSVVHFLRTGCNDPYSQHDFAIPAKEGTADPIPLEGLLTWDQSTETTPFPAIVSRGQTIRAFFTYENLGVTEHNDVPVGFYISENQDITAADDQFAETTVDLIPGIPATVGTDVTLPVDLAEGTVWLGVIVDDGDTIAERFDDNNATFYPLKVVPFEDNPDFEGEGVPPEGLENPRYAFQYSAKVVCGQDEQELHDQLISGRYATTVNIFNGSDQPVALRKQLALSSPPELEEQGDTFAIAEHFLDPNRALAVDCADLQREVFAEGSLPIPDLYEGFVVVDVTDRVAVTAVYSSGGIVSGGGPDAGPHSSIDVETIFARALLAQQPDLIIDMADSNLRCGSAITCTFKAGFTVRNIGDATAGAFEVGLFALPEEALLGSASIEDGLPVGGSTSLSLGAAVSQSPSLPDAICIGADHPANTVAEA